MPTAAGILNIVVGSFSIIGFLCTIFTIILINPDFWINWYSHGPWGIDIVSFIKIMLWFVASITLIMGLGALVSGVYALKRSKWGLTLAGSILAIVLFMPLGVASTILIVLARHEFE
jgi:hypothetical protein